MDDNNSSWSSGVGAAVVGGLLGLYGNSQDAENAEEAQKRAYEYQRLLNEQGYQYQQDLNSIQHLRSRENRLLDDRYQRALTKDSWLLNRKGMEAAGINPAFSSGSTNVTASTPTTSAPTSGSVGTGTAPSGSSSPTNYGASMSNIVDTYLRYSLSEPAVREKAAEADKAESDAKLTKVRNEREIARMTDGKDESSSKARSAAVQADVDENTRDNKIEISNLQLENQKLQNENQNVQNSILGIVQQMKSEELNQAQFITQHQLELFVKQISEIDSRIQSNKASAFASIQSGLLSKAETFESNLRAEFERAKLPYAKDMAYYMRESAMNEAKITFNNMRLSDINTGKAAFDFDTEREWHSSRSSTWFLGEAMRNLLGGWFPFSGSYSNNNSSVNSTSTSNVNSNNHSVVHSYSHKVP